MKIFIDEPIHEAMFDLAKEHRIEWTMFGKSNLSGRNSIHLTDFILPFQTNSTGETEVPTEDPEKKFDPTLEWRTRDRDLKDPKTWRSTDWNVWIHSHNTMPAFWSGTDWEEIENYMKERTDPFVCIVVNSKREYQALVGIPELDFIVEAEVASSTVPIQDLVKLPAKEQKDILARWTELATNTEDIKKQLDEKEFAKPVPVYKSGYKGTTCPSGYDSDQSYWDGNPYATGASYHAGGGREDAWIKQCSFLEELDMDERSFVAGQLNNETVEIQREGYYVCDKDFNIIVPLTGHPYSQHKEVWKKGNLIAYFDQWLTPIGVYTGFSPLADLPFTYEDLYPTTPIVPTV